MEFLSPFQNSSAPGGEAAAMAEEEDIMWLATRYATIPEKGSRNTFYSFRPLARADIW
jgi:hypothetical protein